MDTYLVVGATGYVGRHVVAELASSGHRVRAFVRDRRRAERPGPYGAPSLSGLVDEWVEAEATQLGSMTDVCDGVDRVVSALGVTRQRADPWDVDFRANLELLESAEQSAVASFCYVNVLHVRSGTSLLMRAKSAFVEALRRSDVTPQIVNPSGYFSDVSELVDMARHGVIPQIGPGMNRLNPIHGADLASFIVARSQGRAGEWDVGGPDIMTYRQMEQLAFEAVGRAPRIVTLPTRMLGASVWLADRVGPRAGSLARFFTEGMQHDAVGEPVGSRHLRDWFAEVAAA